MLMRSFILAALLPVSAFAQSSSVDPLFSGFVKVCQHPSAYSKVERALCKAQEDSKTGISKCGPGKLDLPASHTKALDAPSVSYGAPAKTYSSYAYQDEGDYAAYTWNYKPNTIFFGPLVVDQMRLALGHSNGIRYGGVRIQNATTVDEAQKLLQSNKVILQTVKDEATGSTKAQLVLDPEDKRIWLYCDLSN